MMQLKQKHVLVLGGSSGIGLAVAGAALDEGASVTIVGRSPERLEQARRELGKGGRVQGIAADIAREDDVRKLFTEVTSLDHLVTTAADVAYGPVRDLDLDAAWRVIGSKIVGPLLLAKHGAAHIRPGGSITFTSGIAAYRPSRGGSVVAMANGALAALGRALAIELAPIRVNVISPGWVDTPIWETFAGERRAATLAAMAERLPVGRTGEPRDIAHACLFLMTSEYTTGTVLHVDGGQRIV
jgi:NAD(P)-dependent dehydrogenase (short-subunit alcohol dehydrogenase family)